MADVAGLYQEQLLKQNMLDFDDMTLWSIVVVHEHEDLREKHQQQFEHLLVDETATTCSWWATPTGSFDGARRIDLDTTYRSTKNILEAANALIQQKVADRARVRHHAGPWTAHATATATAADAEQRGRVRDQDGTGADRRRPWQRRRALPHERPGAGDGGGVQGRGAAVPTRLLRFATVLRTPHRFASGFSSSFRWRLHPRTRLFASGSLSMFSPPS